MPSPGQVAINPEEKGRASQHGSWEAQQTVGPEHLLRSQAGCSEPDCCPLSWVLRCPGAVLLRECKGDLYQPYPPKPVGHRQSEGWQSNERKRNRSGTAARVRAGGPGEPLSVKSPQWRHRGGLMPSGKVGRRNYSFLSPSLPSFLLPSLPPFLSSFLGIDACNHLTWWGGVCSFGFSGSS